MCAHALYEPAVTGLQGRVQQMPPVVIQIASGTQWTASELGHCSLSQLVQALKITAYQAYRVLCQQPGAGSEQLEYHGSVLRDLDIYGIVTRPEEAGTLANWFGLDAVRKHITISHLQDTAVGAFQACV